MTDKKRLTIRCWNPDCPHPEYTWLATFDGRPTLLIACPFCGAEAVIRLDPYVTPLREPYAGDERPPLALSNLSLPDVLPSEPREETRD